MQIYLGTSDNEHIRLPWNTSNGILIAGKSGSGKSQSAALYLTQYAIKGAKLVICDAGAATGIQETLLDRVTHLTNAFLRPPATTLESIASYIQWIQTIGENRYSGKDADRTPIIFVIDEFSAFILNYKPSKERIITRQKIDDRQTSIETQELPNFLEKLIMSVSKYRKVNIRFVIIGQEWAQMSTSGIRALRSNITDIILHRLDNNGARLFGFTSQKDIQTIMNLPVGSAFYQGSVLRVPLMGGDLIHAATTRIPKVAQVKPQPDTFLAEMLEKYGHYLGRVNIETREDLIKFLMKLGKDEQWITSNVKGVKQDIKRVIYER